MGYQYHNELSLLMLKGINKNIYNPGVSVRTPEYLVELTLVPRGY